MLLLVLLPLPRRGLRRVTLTIQPVTQEVFRAAAEIANRHNISCWDAAIVAAARILGCDAVYSEDLNQGQSYDGVVVLLLGPRTLPVEPNVH